MKMLRCNDCGHLFEDGKQAKWFEKHGEKFYGCPLCRGDYEEVYLCEICEEYHTKDELSNGVCDECIMKHKNNIDLCQEFSKEAVESVELSTFLTTMFTAKEITDILIEKLKSENADCSKFITDDKDWFAEKLIEKKEAEKK